MLITGVHLLAWLIIIKTGAKFVQTKVTGTPIGGALAYINL
jgi:hypothetical protein